MATAFLKRSHAVIWVPPRSVGERAFANEPALLVMRAAGDSSARYARMSLDALPKVKSVSVVFDARDVTILAAQVPALPAAKLQKALPNIVEESLLQDVASCSFAVGPQRPDGKRLVAVIDRAWLEFVIGAFERRGLWVTGAWPAQLTLPLKPGGWAIGCMHNGIAVRTGLYDGFGWVASEDAEFRAEAIVSAATAATAASGTSGLGRDVRIYVEDPGWKASVERAAQRLDLHFQLSGLPVPKSAPIDLLEARQGSASGRWLANVDWRAWRLPLALAAACMVVFLIGLNLHWAQMAQERNALKAQMERKFRQTFPSAQVIVDPLLQMQRQVSSLRSRSGQSGPEDFAPMVARLAKALGPRAVDSLAGIEYRDGKLRVRFQPTFVEARSMRESLREGCQRQGLNLKFDGDSQPTATVSLVS